MLSRWLYYTTSILTILVGMFPRLKIIATFLGLNRQPFVIRLSNGLEFHVRTAMDIWVIKETCLDRDYEQYGVPLQAGWTVIDIGGGLGDFTLFASRLPSTSVYVYEPFPESAELLRQNLFLNQVDNVQVHQQAVGAQNGQLTLKTGTGVAVRHSTAQVDAKGDITIESVTLDDVVDGIEAGMINFLKMDCEGGEYDILFHASDLTLSKIQHICMEYHDDLTPHTHHELVTFLQDKGFTVRTHRNPAHTSIGFLYAGNSGLNI